MSGPGRSRPGGAPGAGHPGGLAGEVVVAAAPAGDATADRTPGALEALDVGHLGDHTDRGEPLGQVGTGREGGSHRVVLAAGEHPHQRIDVERGCR